MLQNVDNFISETSETSGISGISYAVQKAKRSMTLGVAALLVACSGGDEPQEDAHTLKEATKEAIQSVTDLTEKGLDAAVETTGTLTERVTDGAKRVSDSVVEAGKEVVGQGAEVVHDAKDALRNTAESSLESAAERLEATRQSVVEKSK